MTPSKDTRRRWTKQEEAEVVRLRDVERWLWSRIDDHFDRNGGASSAKYSEIKRGVVRIPPGEREPKPRRAASVNPPWTDDQMTLAEHRWQELFVAVHGENPHRDVRFPIFRIIGSEIGRKATAVEARLRTHGPSFRMAPAKQPIVREVVISEAILEARKRHAARLKQHPCSLLMGDPPPGYSALDQRYVSAPTITLPSSAQCTEGSKT